MNQIITISRQFASGGREIGKKLAKRFDIPFYDNELITRAAKESGFSESAFAEAEQRPRSSLIYSIAFSMNAYDYGGMVMPIDDQLYMAQVSIIKKVADEGPCVIIGRCADYILSDYDNVTNVFVWSDIKSRIKRAVDVYEMPLGKAEENIIKIDKKRAEYYKYHTEGRWGNIENYSMSINSSFAGIDGTVDIIADFVQKRK